ncbi:MAG: hypothetical protein WCD67_10055, partial [Xanthobacteraceae bacterium]
MMRQLAADKTLTPVQLADIRKNMDKAGCSIIPSNATRLRYDRQLCKPPMLWRSPSPARHPAGFVEPCLPTLGQAVPSGPQWVHEIKHDGFRFICRRVSRRGRDWTDRLPRIVDTLARLPA